MEFQQIRNASVRITAGTQHQKIYPETGWPLPMHAQEILKETDYILVTHYHPDHFSADYLPKDAPMFFRT